MAIAPRASVSGSGSTTTSMTLVIPETVQAGDWMEAWFGNGGGTADPSVSDDGDAGAWSLIHSRLYASNSEEGTVWGKIATANSAGATITATGFTTTCCGGMDAFSGVDEATPTESIVSEANASGNETMVEVVSTDEDRFIRFFVFNQQVSDTTAVTATDPATLAPLSEHLSGACSGASYGELQGAAGGTGAISWTNTVNGAAGSIAYALVPAPPPPPPGNAVIVSVI